MQLINLKTLHMKNPLGIDLNPYFSWMMQSDEFNVVQTAYQIEVTDTEGKKVWDSGRLESDNISFIEYKGEALKSRELYVWRVAVWDNHGNTAIETAAFETALLSMNDWKASWVEPSMKRKPAEPGFGNQDPATMFRKEFSLSNDPVKARIYVTCHGVYRLTINGLRPDERELAPEHTVYEKYLCYQTYDITKFLNKGKNAIGMYVGDGWYFSQQSLPDIKELKHAHAILFQMEVTYANGTKEIICSDETVKAAYGPVVCSDLYGGERYDANLKKENWDLPGFYDEDWKSSVVADYGYQNLVAQIGEPVKRIMTLPARNVLISPNGEKIVDFGQVIAGRVKMHLNCQAGTRILLEHCEALDKDGNYFDNILGANGVGMGCEQRDEYISDGVECEYEPMFVFHGFRYVKVSGLDDVKAEDFVAVVLSSEKENTGTFFCSDDKLNRLYENTRWSQRSNMLSIPTDCPQREKAGWTGDILIYAKTAMLNEEMTAFLTRWLHNMTCDQDQYGIIPMVVPYNGSYPEMGKMVSLMHGNEGKGTSAGWGDAAVMVPYHMYEITGNTVILKQQYECMKKWCEYVIKQAGSRRGENSELPNEIEQYLWNTGFHYGEWLVPSLSGNGFGDMDGMQISMKETSKYTAPIFGWNSINHFAKIAMILGRYQDAEYFGRIAKKMKDAIQQGVINEKGEMPINLMGAYVLPIYFDLVPDKFKESFSDHLIEMIEKNNMRLDTGFLGTPYLLDALCKIGREDVAYKILWQEECPSWLYEVNNGATTVWESWYAFQKDGTPMKLSMNHYAFGCVDDWIFRYIGGISSDTPGYRHLVIQPRPDARVTSAKRTFMTEHGIVSCEWRRADNGEMKMEVMIPCNSTAAIILPDGKMREVGSGNYTF